MDPLLECEDSPGPHDRDSMHCVSDVVPINLQFRILEATTLHYYFKQCQHNNSKGQTIKRSLDVRGHQCDYLLMCKMLL